MKKQKSSIPTPLAIVLAIIIALLIITKNIVKSHKTSTKRNHQVNLVFENEDVLGQAVKDGKNIRLKLQDKETNEKYNVKIPVEVFETVDKKYYENNKELIDQAILVYFYIAGFEYYTEKYCERYYPIKNFKKEYNKAFRKEKAKARNILERAYGRNYDRLTEIFLTSQDFYKQGQEEIEEMYLESKKEYEQEYPLEDYTRSDYCEGLDSWDEDDVKEVFYDEEEIFYGF